MNNKIESFIDNILKYTEMILSKIVIVLMFLLLIDVWFAIVDRYVFGWQVIWVEEMARYLMIWAIFMSVPIVIMKGENIALRFLWSHLPKGFVYFLSLFIEFISALFFAFIAVYGVDYMKQGIGELSGFFQMQMVYVYAVIPVSFSLMALVSLLLVIKNWNKKSSLFVPDHQRIEI